MKVKNTFIYVGPTGCGKTYCAFNRRNKRQKAVYIAPCRQLVYESAQKYGNANSHIKTSDMEVGNKKTAKLSFRTYESLTSFEVKDYKLIIIDEAHFLVDRERGPHLANLILSAQRTGTKVALLSATITFVPKGTKVIKLPPRGQNFQKEEIPFEQALERAKQGVPTLVFHRRRADCGSIGRKLKIKSAVINADTSVYDRIRLIKLYERGVITLIEATNAMAQGVNVPCENLINFKNSYDKEDVLIQKFGRLGRTGVTARDAKLTWCFENTSKEQIDALQKKFLTFKEISFKKKSLKLKDFDLLRPATAEEAAKTAKLIEKGWPK